MRRFLAILALLACVCGSAFAGGMDAVRGYDSESEQEYQYLLMGTYPYEEDGTEAPLLWRILFREGNIIHLFTEYVIDTRQVMEVDNYVDAVQKHKFHKSDVFAETDLYKWVNGPMAQTILREYDFSAALVEDHEGLFHIMDNTELRRKDWGFPDSTMGNTIENPGETIAKNAKNRKGYGTPYAQTVILYDDWKNLRHSGKGYNKLIQYVAYGRSSPYWTAKITAGWKCGIVGGNGHLSWHGKADVQIGVRPAMVLDLDKLEITGGTGTLEDPWTMRLRGDGAGAAESAEEPEAAAEETPEEAEEAESPEAGEETEGTGA